MLTQSFYLLMYSLLMAHLVDQLSKIWGSKECPFDWQKMVLDPTVCVKYNALRGFCCIIATFLFNISPGGLVSHTTSLILFIAAFIKSYTCNQNLLVFSKYFLHNRIVQIVWWQSSSLFQFCLPSQLLKRHLLISLLYQYALESPIRTRYHRNQVWSSLSWQSWRLSYMCSTKQALTGGFQ